jgi:hypothetical protein
MKIWYPNEIEQTESTWYLNIFGFKDTAFWNQKDSEVLNIDY